MFDFNVGGLYQIKLNNGAYRIIVLGYRTYFEEKPLYFYDLDNCCFGECLREDILNYKSIDINVIQNEELRNKLLNFQRRFPSIVRKEREEDIKLAKIRNTYEVVKARYDKAYNDYNQSICRFYDIEAEGNRLGLELVGSNFTLNNQEMNNSLLSESEFADRIWHYMNSEIKKLLVGSPRFYLSFTAVTNNDDGCFYEFVIYRDRLLEYSYPIRYNTREYHQILQKEIKKEPNALKCLNTLFFKPYEKEDMFYGYRSDISSSYMYHQCGVKKRLDKKRNVYHCRLLSREFSPFPLTEENAKIIGEGIFIADRL